MSLKFDLMNKELSLVIVGGFHALNFTNEWLKHHELICDEDYEASESKFHSSIHVETTLPWLNLQVMPYNAEKNRIALTLTDTAMLSQFMDLTQSVCDMFSTTVVTALGINFTYITKHHDRKSWDEFGHRILPPSNFSPFANNDECHAGMNGASIKYEGLLESVVSLEGDERVTELNINVKPIYYDLSGERIMLSSEIALNYHFPITSDAGMTGAYQTLKNYLVQLNNDIDDKVIKFVSGE